MHKITFKKIQFILSIIFISTLSFALLLYTFFYKQIADATTFIDYWFYSISIFTAVGFSNMYPTTQVAKIVTGLFIILRDIFIIFSLLY